MVELWKKKWWDLYLNIFKASYGMISPNFQHYLWTLVGINKRIVMAPGYKLLFGNNKLLFG
jgi:hypothetical protein